MMDIQTIKDIIALMKANELSELEMESEGQRLFIKRATGGEPQVSVMPMPAAPAGSPAAAPVAAPASAAVPTAPPTGEEDESGWVPIKSPIVGTFYRAPAPDAEPYVGVGSEVDEDTVVCVIEAMKVMNEIKAETRGVVRRILVDNATPVQFGQTLFLIGPA